ncbi:acyltransferase [Erythrobacter sp. MTPC3]|uniref:acyltransferase n=1 Tax=Erythrobacter sp. MTPC3 TaxID=3056564 RepID=UPI0036F37E1D
MSFMSDAEIAEIGFAEVGCDVLISRKASFYGASRITIGSNSRIDDFCVLSAGEGGISIGRHVHVSCLATLIGAGRIELRDFSTCSVKVSIFSSSDDFTGQAMTNPTVPDEFTRVTSGPVIIGRHVIIGTGSVILPNVHIADGASIGSLALVKEDLAECAIYGGVPAKRISARSTDFLELEKQMNARTG